MKSTKRKILSAIVSVVLCLSMMAGSFITVSAEINIADMLAGLTGNGSGGSINILEEIFKGINDKIQEDEEESAIDKFVEGLKNMWSGTPDETPDENPEEDLEEDSAEVVVIDKGAADNIATLFNLTVNELKNGAPAFNKTVIASMDATIAEALQGGLGPITGIVESLIGTKDLFAGVIDGTNNETQVTTKYQYGNDVINNLPIAGKEYVANLAGEDIKDYTITANIKTGAYRMHIDLKDVEGSAAQSGLAHVFDVTDKAYATVELGTMSLNINVKLKYVNNYVECQVNRDGEIVGYTTGMGITFMFQQPDGTYSTKMPYFDVDFEEKGIIYNVITEYSAIDYTLRKMGDADNNNKINSSDARLVLRASAKLETLKETDALFCDVDGNSNVNSSDAREILRASAGLVTLPTTEEILGFREYKRDESVQTHIDDLLAILMAYQAAKDEKEEENLKDYYDKLHGNNGNGETTTKPEETTTGELNTPGNKVDEFIGGIGNIIGGNGSIGDIIGGIFGK